MSVRLIAQSPELQRAAARLAFRFAFSPEKVERAILCVSALFEIRRRTFVEGKEAPDFAIILPQQADWLWHELIVHTKDYRAFIERHFGEWAAGHHQYLKRHTYRAHQIIESHLVISTDAHAGLSADTAAVDGHNNISDHGSVSDHHGLSAHQALDGHNLVEPQRSPTDPFAHSFKPNAEQLEAFQKTLDLLDEEFGLGLRDAGWTEAGWNTPRYRFSLAYAEPFRAKALPNLGDETYQALDVDLSWIAPRLVRRFGLSKEAALVAAEHYGALLLMIQKGAETPSTLHPHVYAALYEHLLWVEVYRTDSAKLFGQFLDWPAYELEDGQFVAVEAINDGIAPFLLPQESSIAETNR